MHHKGTENTECLRVSEVKRKDEHEHKLEWERKRE